MTTIRSDNFKHRDIETAEKILDAAKLDKNDYLPAILSIYIGNDISNEDLKLLEVDESTLKYLLNGNSLVIRGDGDEYACCCSQDKTYSFKVAEISNPLLITSNLAFPEGIDKTAQLHMKFGEVWLIGFMAQIYWSNLSGLSNKKKVQFISNTYFEMKIAKPKVEKLKYLLELNLFSGAANDENSAQAKKYTIEDFLDIIQSSEGEIYKYLNYIEAFNIDGYWRLLEFSYLTSLIEHILKLIDERGWPDNQIPIDELYAELKGLYAIPVLRQIVKYYFLRDATSPNVFEIKTAKICRLYGEIILKKMLRMRLCDFEDIWKRCVPKYDLDVSMLDGLAYVEEQYINYFNLYDLPDDVENRLKVLFEKRKKWPLNDIRVYISDLCADDSEINSLLAKNCRSFNQNGVKYFSSRMN